jgi:hypothetical protein
MSEPLEDWHRHPGEGLRLMTPPVLSVLHIGNDLITVQSYEPVPSAWVRFWYWALLRWRWERIE